MKLILENWKKYLKEGIHPKIQNQINILLEEPELIVWIRHQDDYMEIRYHGSDDIKGDVEASKAEGSGSHAHGGGLCHSGFVIQNTEATSGMGPLLYEVAIEYASQVGGGLISDRRTVSSDARAVWDKYAKRLDIGKKQLDTNDSDMTQLTPDDPKDDCTVHGEDQSWVKDPLNKVYYKKTQEVITALKKAGRLRVS